MDTGTDERWGAAAGLGSIACSVAAVAFERGAVHAYLLSPSPARVAGWWVEGVLDSAAYPRSGRVLRSVGGVKGRGAIAERRPEGPPLTAAVESGHWRRRG